MDPLALCMALAVRDVEILGIEYRCRRLTSREMDPWKGYQLLLVNVPDAEMKALAEEIQSAVEGGADLVTMFPSLVASHLRLRERAYLDEHSQRGESVRSGLLGGGVTHWRVVPAGEGADPGAWRPVRIVIDGEPHQGDGTDADPDIVPVRCLPGGAGTEDQLASTILTLSQVGEVERIRLARFRGGA